VNKVCFALFVSIALCCTSFVFGEEVYKINKLKGKINFDGSPFEESWRGIDYLPMVMFKPNFGNNPDEESEVMIAYDQEYLWVGARLYYKDASKIVSKSKKRDASTLGLDYFGIVLDTYDDNENALAFFTMPSGLRVDYSITNDLVGTSFDYRNDDWNTFWDVKTTRDDNGWYVEMRIPFSSLRFQTVDNTVRMGMIVNRAISHKNEIDTYPAIDPKHGFISTVKPSLAQKVEFEGIEPRKPIYFAPYVLGGFSRDQTLNQEEDEYIAEDETIFEVGGDLKYSITSNLTLDLTVNTDFAQVEADNVQINLTRYPLFFPEKRMFFQERSGIFDYSLSYRENLFYSRNIGLVDGSPVGIYGGARLVGRVNKWDLGFLSMQTEEHKDTHTPSENFTVLRTRRQVINSNSYVGGMITSRLGTDGSHNMAYGLDGIFRLFGDDYLTLKFAQTYEKDSADDQFSSDSSFWNIIWKRRSDEGFAYDLFYSQMGEEFNPGMGFVLQNGIRKFRSTWQYGWLPGESSKWLNYQAKLSINRSERLVDGKLEYAEIAPGLSWLTKSDWLGNIDFRYQKEGVLHDFEIGDGVLVPSGNYSFMGIEGMLISPQTSPLVTRLKYYVGEFYDGKRLYVSIAPTYRVSSSLELSADYEFNRIEFPDRAQELRSHIARATVLYMYSTKISASAFIQYNSTDDAFITNFRLRYNPREGNDFYLVLNEDRTVGNNSMTPEPPSYNNRTIMLKYTHTFGL